MVPSIQRRRPRGVPRARLHRGMAGKLPGHTARLLVVPGGDHQLNGRCALLVMLHLGRTGSTPRRVDSSGASIIIVAQFVPPELCGRLPPAASLLICCLQVCSLCSSSVACLYRASSRRLVTPRPLPCFADSALRCTPYAGFPFSQLSHPSDLSHPGSRCFGTTLRFDPGGSHLSCPLPLPAPHRSLH